jgi:hypothetical protein
MAECVRGEGFASFGPTAARYSLGRRLRGGQRLCGVAAMSMSGAVAEFEGDRA